MAFKLKVLDEYETIFLIHDQDSADKDQLESRDQLINELNHTGYRKVLWDIQLAPPPSCITFLHRFIEELSKQAPLGTKFAAIISLKNTTPELVNFGQTVAYNRGLSGRTFMDYTSACQWLEIDKDAMNKIQ